MANNDQYSDVQAGYQTTQDPWSGAWLTPQDGEQSTSFADTPAPAQTNQGMLSVRMPDGSVKTFPATASNNGGAELDAALHAGGIPLDGSGNKMSVSQAYGGWLVGGQPLNYVYGAGYLPGQEAALRALGGTPNGSFTQPLDGSGTPAGGTQGTIPGDFSSMLNGSPIPQIGGITLADNPQISQVFSPQFDQQWQQFASAQPDAIASYYNEGNWPTMTGAQLDTSNIPQVTAATPQGNSALDFLLSGQGYDPAMMSRMRSTAIDDAAMAGRSNQGSARLAAQQAGLGDSPAGLALVSQAQRNQGDSTTRSLNQLEINNAQQGMQNLTTGAGMELGRSTNAASMTNQAALANAAAMFAGMQQNVQNVQQANQTNTANQQQNSMTRAQQQSNLYGQLSGAYNSAMLGKATSADEINTNNAINKNLNQAQLDRQQAMYNTQTGENRYSQGLGAYVGLINGTNPFAYNAAASGQGYTPNLGYANMFSNSGNALINAGLPKQ